MQDEFECIEGMERNLRRIGEEKGKAGGHDQVLLDKHRALDKNEGSQIKDEKKRRERQIERIEKEAEKIEKFLKENKPKINKKTKKGEPEQHNRQ